MTSTDHRPRIGRRLRELRRARGLTIEQVAGGAGVTAGFISQLERDLTSVSLGALARICGVLDVRIGDVLEGLASANVRRRGRRKASAIVLEGQELTNLTLDEEQRMHATHARIAPGVTAGKELYTLPADLELVYVIEGALEFRIGDEVHRLEAGESLTYSPRDPHTWRNPSDQSEAVILAVAVPNPYARNRSLS